MDQALGAMVEAARRTRRRRIRFLARSYDRARDLPRILPVDSFLIERDTFPRLVGTWLLDTPETVRLVMRVLVSHLRRALAERSRRDARIDQLRIALAGEAAIYARLRARALFVPVRWMTEDEARLISCAMRDRT